MIYFLKKLFLFYKNRNIINFNLFNFIKKLMIIIQYNFFIKKTSYI